MVTNQKGNVEPNMEVNLRPENLSAHTFGALFMTSNMEIKNINVAL